MIADMRIVWRIVWLMVLIAACKGGETTTAPSPSTPNVVSGSASAPMGRWETLAALAVPVATPGPSRDLERAIQIAKTHRDAWRKLRSTLPPPPLSDYAEGGETIAALEAWAAANGGLPAIESPMEFGPLALNARSVAQLAIETSTPERDTAKLGVQLGAAFVQQARNLIELQIGLSTLMDAKRKLKQPIDLDVDFVRVLAAEALFARRSMTYFQTPQGNQELDESISKLDPNTKEMLEGVTGANITELAPNKARDAALEAFWLAALEGARRGEAVSVTIARLRKTADSAAYADTSVQQIVRVIPDVVERMKRQLDELASEPSAP